jgi:hypothetical protein
MSDEMHVLIKQLYEQSYKKEDNETILSHAHSKIFDIDAFAQRIVFRCALTAKLAVAEGHDPYEKIIEKYGVETCVKPPTIDFDSTNELI